VEEVGILCPHDKRWQVFGPGGAGAGLGATVDRAWSGKPRPWSERDKGCAPRGGGGGGHAWPKVHAESWWWVPPRVAAASPRAAMAVAHVIVFGFADCQGRKSGNALAPMVGPAAHARVRSPPYIDRKDSISAHAAFIRSQVFAQRHRHTNT
jgi:hypothetical protein